MFVPSAYQPRDAMTPLDENQWHVVWNTPSEWLSQYSDTFSTRSGGNGRMLSIMILTVLSKKSNACE